MKINFWPLEIKLKSSGVTCLGGGRVDQMEPAARGVVWRRFSGARLWSSRFK